MVLLTHLKAGFEKKVLTAIMMITAQIHKERKGGKLTMSSPSQSKPNKQAGKDHEIKHGHRGYAFGLAPVTSLTFRR